VNEFPLLCDITKKTSRSRYKILSHGRLAVVYDLWYNSVFNLFRKVCRDCDAVAVAPYVWWSRTTTRQGSGWKVQKLIRLVQWFLEGLGIISTFS